MTKLKVHPRSEAANIHLRTRLEAAFAMSKGLGRDFVTALLLRFGAAIEAQDKAARTPLRAELHSTLDQIEAHHVT